jgi:hypothetical protein
MPDETTRRSEASGIPYPGPHSAQLKPQPAGKPAEEAAVLKQITPAPEGRQTLYQPKFESKLELPKDLPIPTVVLLTPEKAPVKTIVPPKPEAPAAAEVQPVLAPPNAESNVADIRLSATDLPTKTLPMVPSTTSPIVVHGPDLPQKPPQTVSETTAPPTPTTVVSLSDVQMKQGSVVLPPANQSASRNQEGAMAQGQGKAQNPSQSALHTAEGKGGSATGPAAGDSKQKEGQGKVAGKPSETKAGAGTKSETAAVPKADPGTGSRNEAGTNNGSAQGNRAPTEHISLPKNGIFGSVIVGVSIAEKYPEARSVLGGRLAYTVYLHVGLAKSWILQYSLPRSADAAAAGSTLRLEAPWPYNIVRPVAGAGDINADALMVHGFVNEAGRFEGLTIVFPTDFAEPQAMLDSLNQWQFRPATQNGQNVKVEILLIIPEEIQ